MNILPYMENTPVHIKLSLSRLIFDQNKINFRSYITFLKMVQWARKPTIGTVPLNFEKIPASRYIVRFPIYILATNTCILLNILHTE